MPKSKNRRPNRQPQQTQSPLPAPSLPQANSRSLLQTLGHTWTAIVSIGAIGGFLSLVEHSWDFFVVHTQPKIEGPGLATDPFVLPFTIKNVSSFFEIREAQWTCQIPSLTFGNSSFTNLAMRAEGTTTIAPNSNALARCSIKISTSNLQAVVTPVIQYKTLWISREYSDASFTWLADANPPHWMEGRSMQ